MTIEELKETLKDYGWTQDGKKWKMDRRVFTVHDDGSVCYQGEVSMTADVDNILLAYGTNELEIRLEDETVEVQL